MVELIIALIAGGALLALGVFFILHWGIAATVFGIVLVIAAIVVFLAIMSEAEPLASGAKIKHSARKTGTDVASSLMAGLGDAVTKKGLDFFDKL